MPAMRFELIATTLVLGLIAGCTTAPSAPAPQPPIPSLPSQPREAQVQQPPPNAATKAASTRANLAREQQRLAELFRGTPVVFALQADGSMRVEVPLRYSFDAGSAAVKPPLAAVLDRIATGQRNELTRVSVSAPADAGAKGPALVKERSVSVQAYLVAHGLADARVSISTTPSAALVRIVVTDVPLP